uniref:DUF1725 domain-containing protein n=1 Tax=Pipistrellus kuhlii TaxID=59472 RepID=A0A7J7VV86_PIPKU|nr:hypothetical protein mPipKuh1_008327 [Pipistrellus kuhlii]
MGLHQNKKHNKEIINKTTRKLIAWENVFPKVISDKSLISNIYRKLIQLNKRKINNPIKKWVKDLNRHFLKEDIQKGHENMLKVTHYPRDANQNNNVVPSHTCQNSYHQQINKQVLARMQRKRNPHALLVEMQTSAATVENNTVSSKKKLKKKMELPFDPVIPLPGIYPKTSEIPIRKDTYTPMFIAAQFTIAKIWKQPKCPSADEWIRKQWYIYTMGHYTALKKRDFLPFATAWMDLDSIMLNEITQPEEDKHHMISLICGI